MIVGGHKESLKLLAQSVGGALCAYIEVHDRIFQEASTFRSVLKRLFGKGIPMAELLATAERLGPSLAAVSADLSAFHSRAAQDLDPGCLRYLDLLEAYVGALQDTVDALISRQRLLAEGAGGGRKNPLTWHAFQDAEREYKRAIDRYKLIGLDLNSAAPLIFG
jgi:hypothetical protein